MTLNSQEIYWHSKTFGPGNIQIWQTWQQVSLSLLYYTMFDKYIYNCIVLSCFFFFIFFNRATKPYAIHSELDSTFETYNPKMHSPNNIQSRDSIQSSRHPPRHTPGRVQAYREMRMGVYLLDCAFFGVGLGRPVIGGGGPEVKCTGSVWIEDSVWLRPRVGLKTPPSKSPLPDDVIMDDVIMVDDVIDES